MVQGEDPKKDSGRREAPEPEKRINLGEALGKGDRRHAPPWLPRALAMVMAFAFLAVFLWKIWGDVRGIVCDLVVCLFLSLAMEPAVKWLIRHGWKRALAAFCVWIFVLAVAGGFVWIFGSLFVTQATDLVSSIPKFYQDLRGYVDARTSFKLPEIRNLGSFVLKRAQSSWIGNFASTAASVAAGATHAAISFMIILFVTYYIMSSGPKMQRSICSCLKPSSQKNFLIVWTVVQNQVSSFLSSRIILATISSVCMAIYMLIMHVPYWLPLCLMYALVSQFIPMVGAFIGAILPLVIVWTDQGFKWALFLAIYILVYQQVENMILAPKIQQKTMSVHPAIGLIAVFVFGEAFGVLGSFLALPITASLEVVFDAYFMRTSLVDSPLLSDPAPEKKSKMARAAQDLAKKVSPLSSRFPRRAKGSTRRAASIREQLRDAGMAYESYRPDEELDSSRTVAMVKREKQDRPEGLDNLKDSPRTHWKDKE
ncbi:MAG: AI-2E family transporter [Aeriscardovia sp.]|nr:AI-2E family transporter [Aeriscardovia sp.]